MLIFLRLCKQEKRCGGLLVGCSFPGAGPGRKVLLFLRTSYVNNELLRSPGRLPPSRGPASELR